MPVGLVMEADEFQEVEGVYPDNWQVYKVFNYMATQWRVGVNGASGLVYSSLDFVFRIMKVATEEEEEIFSLLRIMEMAALESMGKKR